MKDFDAFTKIALQWWRFGQNNCFCWLWKVAQSALNRPIWSHRQERKFIYHNPFRWLFRHLKHLSDKMIKENIWNCFFLQRLFSKTTTIDVCRHDVSKSLRYQNRTKTVFRCTKGKVFSSVRVGTCTDKWVLLTNVLPKTSIVKTRQTRMSLGIEQFSQCKNPVNLKGWRLTWQSPKTYEHKPHSRKFSIQECQAAGCLALTIDNYATPNILSSVIRKKSRNVYNCCPKIILLEKWYILTPL